MEAATTAKPHSLRLWWWILILGCLISVVLNIWHAVTLKTGDEGHPVLGIIFALVPVLFAALLSHGLVSPGAAPWFKAAILALFGISMITSISSQAAVMKPYGGGYGAEWSIPIVLDAAAILALYFITSRSAAAREAAAEADREAELEAIREDLRPSVRAEVRAELQTELDALRTELEAEVERNREAELDAVRAELRAELGPKFEAELTRRLEAAEAEFRRTSAAEEETLARRVEVETEARLRREFAEQAKQQGGRKASAPAPRKTAEDGLTRKDRAKILLRTVPDMTAAELATALGCTDRYARDLLKEISEEAGQTSPAHPPLRAVL
ncbi:hypothetical protein ABZW49_20175 [Nonomuraea wenchangensis]